MARKVTWLVLVLAGLLCGGLSVGAAGGNGAAVLVEGTSPPMGG